jgi:DNA-binding response OmpR family regulator
MKNKILVIDDNVEFLNALDVDFRKESDLEVHSASDLEIAKNKLQAEAFDLVVLDYHMGDQIATNLVSTRRSWVLQAPVLMMSGLADRDILMSMLNMGVAGFIEKPLQYSDLRERIFAICKAAAGPETFDFGSFLFNPAIRRVEFASQQIQLTPIEAKIFKALLRSPGQLVRREALAREIWGTSNVSRHTFDTHFGNLKSKLPFLAERLRSIYGQGYCFVPQN